MFLSDNDSLKKRFFEVIAFLFIYRFGTFVPLPGVDSNVLRAFFEGGISFGGALSIFSGGSVERMSVFALSIMPYITASIIMQLASSMKIGSGFFKQEVTEYSKAKLTSYTRVLSFFLALMQSIGVYYALRSGDSPAIKSNSIIFFWTTSVTLVCGSCVLMWIGERITIRGVGNGVSLIIFIGIASSIPVSLVQVFELLRSGVYNLFFVVVGLLFFVVLLILTCFFERVYRKIKIHYPASSQNRSSFIGKNESYLPIKINTSGAIPPIFATSLLTLPFFFSKLFDGIGSGGDNFSFFFRGGGVYFFAFSTLIVFFSYFYSSIVFDSKEVAANLRKAGCFFLGLRPGVETARYIDGILSKITLFGALYLVIICAIPDYIISKYSIPLNFGGVGILIAVSVVTDVFSQVQSHLVGAERVGRSLKRKARVKYR